VGVRKARVAGFILLFGLHGLVASSPSRVPSTGSQELTLPLILAIEDARAPTIEDVRVLRDATRSGRADVRAAAIRALGRLERRDVVGDLLPLLAADATRAEAANAVAQALRGAPVDAVASGAQEQIVLDALLAAGEAEMRGKFPTALTAVARSIGRLPYSRPHQIESAEAFLLRVLTTPFPALQDEPHVGATRGLESLARLNRKIHTLDEETILRLRAIARSQDPKRSEHQRNAVAALVAAQGVDHPTLLAIVDAQDMEVRRLAVLSLAGAGADAGLPEDERIRLMRALLSDTSSMVRLEAVRAWARRAAAEHGCVPILERLVDHSLHVVLTAIDALGDSCRDDQNVTDRLTAEANNAPVFSNWQREAHALVALAKRAPDRASLRLTAFAEHPVWQVRMYAARAAALVEDEQALTKLAEDPEDGVAEAALPALRRLIGSKSDTAFVGALNRRNRKAGPHDVRPYQVIRTAAIALERAESTPALVGALADALERITDEQCETSRDVRLALIARLGELGSPEQAPMLMPLLKDIDPVVAATAADVIATWTGRAVVPDVLSPPVRAPPPSETLSKPASVVVEMASGKTFEIRFNAQAPLARVRFLDLVNRGYYNDLTFHRIAPNFVIQGGSPNAHEYCGACPFARDEVSLAMNHRGTIGISTRGRDTGDSQIFVNLVDNPRLDHEYTVFASVCRDDAKDGLEVVDAIQEGDRMSRLRVVDPGKTCR
jgi:cyclophilin family peptidyl-prolyl cis-trans isomerase/HEAT repeat protein